MCTNILATGEHIDRYNCFTCKVITDHSNELNKIRKRLFQQNFDFKLTAPHSVSARTISWKSESLNFGQWSFKMNKVLGAPPHQIFYYEYSANDLISHTGLKVINPF
jgi:hypothetical protein